jgi:hypothetical protein
VFLTVTKVDETPADPMTEPHTAEPPVLEPTEGA